MNVSAKNNPTIYELFKVNKDKKIFLYFGRYGKTKGTNILFKAISLIQNKIPKDFAFGFVTDNPEAITADVKKYKIRPEIVLNHQAVPHDKIANVIKTAYCVIVPSITEGFGFTTAETCQLGTPVICSDTGSLPEVVSGKCLVFQNRNHYELSKKIIAAAQNRFKMRPKKNFDWSISAKAISELYHGMV